MRQGQVTLVGAGPGDPGLLTLRGREALLRAEVVVYDRLVSPAILDMIPPSAERVDVGKEASHHKIPQDRINRILLDKALEGKRVVRLKGGDPFLFGRGGEELELLSERGIPFSEVPGVTSAIAAAAYAGIPVTHRSCCSSVHIITGHQRAGKELSIDFAALARTGGTLIFLMGVTAMPMIVRGLLDAGMDGDTPAAMVENGTLSAQRRCDATLSTLPRRASEMGIRSPAIIVVGKVCALAEGFDWFSRLPLKGRAILVTRPKERAGALSDSLRALGADVWEHPCIETVPILPCPAMEEALTGLSRYDALCLTSPAGAEALWNGLRAIGRDARALSGLSLSAIGPGTARALTARGLAADYIPPVYDAAHLGEGLPARGPVLILRAEEGSPDLTEALKRRNIPFDDIPVYRTRYEHPQSAKLRAAVEAGAIRCAAFTSASTVKGFVSSVGGRVGLDRLIGLCIGERTADEARRHGIQTRVAREATIEALTELAVQCAEEDRF